MKKSYIVKSLGIMALFLVVLSACKQKNKDDVHVDKGVLEIDNELRALLKPTNQEVVSTIPTIKAQGGMQLVSVEIPGRISYDARNQTSIASKVSGRIERLYVKYNYQPISKGDLIMEIYSPDLAAAQRDLLLLANESGQERLLANAKQRLLLLGMASSQIDRVIKTGKVNYRVPIYSNASGYILEKDLIGAQDAMNESKPILLREGQYVTTGQSLFSVYRKGDLIAEFSLESDLLPYIKKGTGLLIQQKGSDDVFKETIGLIEPTFKEGESFSMARVYVNNSKLHPGQLVKAHVPILIKEGWWLPKDAVWKSGIESIVFKKEGTVFIPKTVKTGVVIDGKVQILEDISSWDLASKAYYLVDSESFIRPQNTKK